MPVIHIPPRAGDEHIHAMNEHIDNGNPAFVLLYMEGCGPCGMTRPEWLKLNDKYSKNDNIGIIDIEMSEIDKITHPKLKADVMGFPTMRYVKNNVCEDYEKCKGLKTDRSYKSFLEWIAKKENNASSHMRGGRRSRARRGKKSLLQKKTRKRDTRRRGARVMSVSVSGKMATYANKPKGVRRQKNRKSKSNKRKYNKSMYKTKKHTKKGGVNPAAKREAFISAEKGDLGYIKWILNNGYDVNEKEPLKEATLLHYASHNGHIDLVKLLIERGADVNAKDIKGYTPLFAASARGHREVAEILLDNGANVHEDPTKLNPLYAATNQRHRDTALLLVERGAWPLTLLKNL